MNAHAVALAIGRALVSCSAPALDHVRVYAHDCRVHRDGIEERVNEIELPAIFVKVRFEALVGSANIGTGTVEITVESQLDDDTSAVHSAREVVVRQVMGQPPLLQTAFTEISEELGAVITLCGKPALTENAPDVENRAFVTPYTYLMGVAEGV